MVSILLEYDVASLGNQFPTFQDKRNIMNSLSSDHTPQEEKHQVHQCENHNKSLSTIRSILRTPATDMAYLNQLTGR